MSRAMFFAVHLSMNYLRVDELSMRTMIEIDDQLMQEAMRRSGTPSREAVVEAGLRLLLKTHAQTEIRQLRGKVRWEGDIPQSRP